MAQSIGAFQSVPANWWVHHGLVNFGGRKMSKSAGVPVTIRSITAEFHPEALRLYLLDRSYRRPIEYSRCALYEAAARLNRFYFFLNQSRKMLGTLKSASPLRGWIWQRFCEALDDDVDIARGLSILFQAVGNLNRRLYAGRLHREAAETEKLRRECAEVVGILKGVVGILGQRPQDYIGTNTVLQNSSPFFSRADIESLLAKRLAARKAGQWEKADQIRKQLAARDVQIRDAADGSRWKLGKICGFIPYQP
jgi:cysteinyl-tRNA synthetase